MSRTARVKSIEVLQTIAVALKRFRGEASSAMDDLDVEFQRAMEWIHHDRKEYWTRERRKAEDRVAEARIQLKQAQSARSVADYRPTCVDEQRALERAKQRLQIAEQKVKAVQRWTNAIEQAINNCRRARTQFVVWLDTDMPKAVALLNRMSDTLEHYTTLEAPTNPDAPVALPTDSSQEGLLDLDSAEAPGESGPSTEPGGGSP